MVLSKIFTTGAVAYEGVTSLGSSPDSIISSGSPTYCVAVALSYAEVWGTTPPIGDVSAVRFYDGSTSYGFTKRVSVFNSRNRMYGGEAEASMGTAVSMWTLDTDISGKTGSFRAVKNSVSDAPEYLVPDEADLYIHVYRNAVSSSAQYKSNNADGVTSSVLTPEDMDANGDLIHAYIALRGTWTTNVIEDSYNGVFPVSGRNQQSSFTWDNSSNVAHAAFWIEGSPVVTPMFALRAGTI